ncbi:reverse transcriptase domain-containing protein [Tanacetum coccineum]
MILELADRTISTPTGIAKDVFVKVGTFFFPADFVVVDYVADPQVPLILGRPFLRTARALIDVHGEEMTLRHYDQSVTFKVGDTKTFSYNIIKSVNRVDVIDIACEEYVQEVLESGNPTSPSDLMIDSRSPSFTPFGGSDFLMEEIDAFLEHDDSIPPGVDGIYDSEGDTVYLEELLSVINSDPNLPPSPVCEINVPEKIKSSCEDPPDLELKDLPSHLEYAFLEGDDKLPVIIAKNLKDEDKTALIKVLKSHKHAIAWKISDIKGIDPQFCTHKILMEENAKPVVQHQRRVNPKIHEVIKQEVIKLLDAGLIYPISDSPWARSIGCMVAIFHDMIEKTMEVFMDDFSVFGDSFSSCLSHLDKMLQRCEDTNLVLNWEKCHFMVKEGIVLGHKISKSGIEVDKSKVDVIAKLPHPTTVKVLGQRKTKHFQPIHYASKTMTEAQAHYTTTEKELLAVVYAFEKFRPYLVLSKSIVYTDHSALKYLLAKQDAKPRLLRARCFRHSQALPQWEPRGDLRPDLQTFHLDHKIRGGSSLGDLKQALRGRLPMLIVDRPDCEDSRAFASKKEIDSDVILIELVKDDEYPINDELNKDDNEGEEEFKGNHFDKFPTCSELAYQKYLMHDPYLSKIVIFDKEKAREFLLNFMRHHAILWMLFSPGFFISSPNM